MPTPTSRPIATRIFELFAQAPKFTHDQSGKVLAHGMSGIYVMFEEGQTLPDGGLRITRIGTHREPKELKRRLEENAQTGKMAQSVFRRQVASALMQQAGTDAAVIANAVSQKTFPHHVDVKVTEYLRTHCSYAVIVIGRELDSIFGKEVPWLALEKRLVGQLAYAEPRPAADWLGHLALDPKISPAGLWNTTNLTTGWKGGVCEPDEPLLQYLEAAFDHRK